MAVLPNKKNISFYAQAAADSLKDQWKLPVRRGTIIIQSPQCNHPCCSPMTQARLVQFHHNSIINTPPWALLLPGICIVLVDTIPNDACGKYGTRLNDTSTRSYFLLAIQVNRRNSSDTINWRGSMDLNVRSVDHQLWSFPLASNPKEMINLRSALPQSCFKRPTLSQERFHLPP